MTYGRRYEEMYNNISGVNFNDILYLFNVSLVSISNDCTLNLVMKYGR